LVTWVRFFILSNLSLLKKYFSVFSSEIDET
jgi:cytochrome c oxidase subunit IV